MQYAKCLFAGIELDTYMVDDVEYLTAASMANGLKKDARQANNWLRRGGKVDYAIDVDVKTGNGATRKAKAYPLPLMVEMVEYWADKGDIEAKALRTAILQSDLQRTVREAHGITVTSEQHESNRRAIRLDLVAKIIKKHVPGTMLEASQFVRFPELQVSEAIERYRVVRAIAAVKKTSDKFGLEFEYRPEDEQYIEEVENFDFNSKEPDNTENEQIYNEQYKDAQRKQSLVNNSDEFVFSTKLAYIRDKLDLLAKQPNRSDLDKISDVIGKAKQELQEESGITRTELDSLLAA